MRKFVIDTSALISLECVELLDTVLLNFNVSMSFGVMAEVREFSQHPDVLGKAALRVLGKNIPARISKLSEYLEHVSSTDNEVFNLALADASTLITDDVKLWRHSEDKITVEFSTFFLITFVESEIITRQQALQKLETMRTVRNWQNNIIYITAKAELEAR